ncbi:hypothetical protein BXZ70DRAFT_1006359 [Cristinia sonorae]|uniref:Uncharacterized protein n=1 Tax=Cristinia sonorae TaxID=1940300 RepID=A0A8K0USI4_9AGAR|nr:hypothetical protein BXZ70DRAFT_1006359 [Cristinia sonorae]
MNSHLLITRDDWLLLDRIFTTSPAAFNDLLQPDRESGLLSDDDFKHLRLEMHWSNRLVRRYRAPASLLIALGVGVTARRSRSVRTLPPRWRWAASATAGFLGFTFSVMDAFATDILFEKHLKDPRAVQQSIHNVRARLLPTMHPQEPETWTDSDNFVEDRDTSAPVSPSSVTVESNARASGNTSWPQSGEPNNFSSNGSPSPQQQHTPKSRWDEIRAANSRGISKSSSWDVLREKHERGRVAPQESQPTSSHDADRAMEQAKFDALLEAERRQSHAYPK